MTEYNFQIDSAAVSDRGLSEKRPQNEDSFLEIAERGVFAVADGVGGAQAGDVASSMAMEILGEAFVNTRANSDAEEVMQLAIQHANSSIYQMSRDLPQLATMATTVVALHVAGNIATIGHVGDSRLYRLDGNGNLYRETQDHSVVEEEVRAGRMTPAQAANHPSRNVISRALGAEPTVEIDMKTIMFEPQTSFLICSDGITRHVDDFEIRQLLLMGESPSEICAEFKKLCYERGAEDNLTAVVIRISEAVAPTFTENSAPVAIETEEPTVAAVRAPEFDEDSLLELDEAEIPTQNLVMPQTAVDESKIPTAEYPTTQAEDNLEVAPAIAEVQEQIAPVAIGEIQPQPPIITAQTIEPDSEVLTSLESEKSGGGFFGKLLAGLLLLLIGAALGAGGYYLWTQMNKPSEVPQLAPQSPNIPYTAFEEARRSVDNEPKTYIAKNASLTQNAEGGYLLGRAYLLTGDFAKAKSAFEEAKLQLTEVGAVNKAVLSNDIEVGLALAKYPAVQEEFKKSLSKPNSSDSGNSNTNSATENKPKTEGAP